MLPLLHSDDVVLVRIGPEVARDAIVVARRADDGYVVKRVGRVGAASIELLSLNPEFEPTLIERGEGTVAGTVVLRWCGHGG
jgi:phage repressor protein C with HTH and peptisase S24 domain